MKAHKNEQRYCMTCRDVFACFCSFASSCLMTVYMTSTYICIVQSILMQNLLWHLSLSGILYWWQFIINLWNKFIAGLDEGWIRLVILCRTTFLDSKMMNVDIKMLFKFIFMSLGLCLSLIRLYVALITRKTYNNY